MSFDDEHPLPPGPSEPPGLAPEASRQAAEVPAPPAQFVQEDLRAPWGWADLLFFMLAAIVASVVVGVIVFLGFAALGHGPTELRTSPRMGGVFGVVYEVLLFAGLLGFLALYLRLRFGAPFWRTIGWRRFEAGRFPLPLTYMWFVAGGFLLAMVVQLASAYFGQKAKVPMEALFQDRLVAMLLLLMAVLIAPLVEETLFRGFLYPVIARSFGQGVGIVATGTLFGLLHAAQLWGGWTQIALLVFVGIVLTYARAAKRTVLASYLLHVSYNFAISAMFLIASHGLRVLPKGS